jgi:spoIIIJ-associated protein
MDEKNRQVEISARSVDDAVAQALRLLGLQAHQVEIEIIRQGSRGLLGLLSEDAVVRVTPKRSQSPVPAPSRKPIAEEAELPFVALKTVPASPTPESHEEEISRAGADVLQHLISGLGLHARVAAEQTPLASDSRPDSVYLNVLGEGLGGLIGRRGATLNDLQYLTCLLVSRRVQRWPSLVVDVEGYKARREKSLVELAKRMADRVRATELPIPLEPMPPNERRIVHLALRDEPDVYTESSGEDDERKVVIRPKE